MSSSKPASTSKKKADDKKESKALAKEAKRKKQETKAVRKETKKSKKSKNGDGTGGGGEEEDMDDAEFDKLVNEILKKNVEHTTVTVEKLDQPPSELKASFSVTLAGPNQPADGILMFGGEYFDGMSSKCFNQTLRCRILATTPEWRLISSPNTPPQRCAHCSTSSPTHAYIFGGEFSTAWKFHHYNDLWRFDYKTNIWQNMPSINGPSPRSGARMVLWKHFLIVFGGFYEASRGVRWHDDLHMYDLKTEKWNRIKAVTTAISWPSARSGFQFVCHPTKPALYMFGGYSKIVTGANQRARPLDDMWILHLVAGKQNTGFPECKWEYLPKKGGLVPPKRSGATSCLHRNRILMFGGVSDTETSNNVIGEFSNDLFAFDLDRHRWFKLALKSQNQAISQRGDKKNSRRLKKRVGKDEGEVESTDEEDEQDDVANGQVSTLRDDAFYILVDGKFVLVEGEEDGGEEEEESVKPVLDVEPMEPIKTVVATPLVVPTALVVPSTTEEVVVELPWGGEPAPPPRIATGLFVSNHKLFVYGGTCERGAAQITFDDMWMLDLNKMDAWLEITAGEWRTQQWNEEAESEDEDSDDSEDEDEEDEEEDEAGKQVEQEEQDEEDVIREANVRELNLEIQELKLELGVDEAHNTPQPNENLMQFFKRTCEYWVAECATSKWVIEDRITGKELRGLAFVRCKRRFDLLSPLLEKLNALQEAQQLAEEEYALESKTLAEKLAKKQAKRALLSKRE
ncbi:hypothetical protein BASA81_002015 [Batrachochytrium salamandrivorans]|nr:hypothetical protein BASA81_002015 [Batrachochytrium salamandrivorans]